MFDHISVVQIYIVVFLFHIIFGVIPFIWPGAKCCLSDRFRKLRYFYLIIGICYLMLAIKYSHKENIQSIIFMSWIG